MRRQILWALQCSHTLSLSAKTHQPFEAMLHCTVEVFHTGRKSALILPLSGRRALYPNHIHTISPHPSTHPVFNPGRPNRTNRTNRTPQPACTLRHRRCTASPVAPCWPVNCRLHCRSCASSRALVSSSHGPIVILPRRGTAGGQKKPSGSFIVPLHHRLMPWLDAGPCPILPRADTLSHHPRSLLFAIS